MLLTKPFLTRTQAIQLSKLHFFNNMSGDIGCEHFARIINSQNVQGKMKDLRFSGTRAGTVSSWRGVLGTLSTWVGWVDASLKLCNVSLFGTLHCFLN
jgi:hypothetical protein